MRSIIVLALLLSVLSTVKAHMFLSSVWNNGAETSQCVRKHPQTQYDYPLSDKVSRRFTSTSDMICGWSPALDTATDSKCPVNAGSTIQLQWWHANKGDDVVDSTHKGPCSVYMAKSDSGKGAVWFKIFEMGYDASTGEWCTDKVRKEGNNKGRVDVTIPASLAAGNYLIRSEFWALHEGYTEYGAQPYVGCAELTISGNGNAQPPKDLINFEGYYKPTDPGLLFNVYNTPGSQYVIPGGRVAVLAGGSTTSGGSPTTSPTVKPTTTPSNPGSTASPTTAPGTCSSYGQNSCSVGALGCQCSVEGLCDRNLRCFDPKKDKPSGLNLCLPIECATGSEKCICTQGGSCDEGLTCYSNTCVRVTKKNGEDSLKESSSSSLSFSLVLSVLGAVVAFVL